MDLATSVSDDKILKTFRLQILSARDLPTKRLRAPKPFVRIKIDTQFYITCTAERSICPVWKDEFMILVQEGWDVEFCVVQDGSLRELGRSTLLVTSFWDPHLLHSQQVRDLQLVDTSGQPIHGILQIFAVEILSSSPRMTHMKALVERAHMDALNIPSTQQPSTADSPRTDFLSSVSGIITSISQLKPVIDRLAKAHPYANLAWQILTVVHNSAKSQRARDVKVLGLVSTMQDAFRWLTATDMLSKIELLEDTVTDILRLCCRCGVFIHWYTSNTFQGRVARDIMTNTEQRIAAFEDSFQNLTKNLNLALSIQTALIASNIDRAIRDTAHKRIHDHLACETATWDPTLTCQPGTREEILQAIMTWLDTVHHQNLFWLTGLAGSGKSTVAHTVASMLASMSRLGGCFFFSRHLSDRNEAKSVMTTLAHALASFSESIRDAIAKAIDKNVNVGKGPLRRQFLDLVVEPLKHYLGHQTIVIVLDALDECATPAMREDLLTILAHDSAQLPSFVRLFVTGRPERDIDAVLGQNPRCLKQLIDLDSQSNIKDITAYVTLRLERIVLSNPQRRLSASWPGAHRKESFVRHSAGLFVWASTACNFIRGSFSPEKALERLLSGEMPTSATAAIDSLYATALASVEGWQDEDFIPAYQVVVGTVVALKDLLPSQIIRQLLGPELRSVSIEQVVSSLGCVLAGAPGGTIRVLHPSFSDYLTSRVRCKDIHTLIDLVLQHRRIATCCLSRMEATLKHNVCGLSDDSLTNAEIAGLTQLIDRHIPEDVQYACRFWAEHVTKLAPDSAIAQKVYKFLNKHALHWMEIMSLTGRSGHIVSCLHVVRIWAQGTGDTEFENLVYDLERFAQIFAVVIREIALHIYISALPFTPLSTTLHSSTLSNDWRDRGVRIVAGADHYWPICLRTLEGHTNWVQSVAFSPDGKLASGSDDSTVRVWDPLRGISYLELTGHRDGVTSVAFSSSGGKIISGSKDARAFVWDTSSGELLVALEGHRLGVSSVAFSPDRLQAITGSFDTTIRFWDATLGDPLHAPVNAHRREVTSVALSARGDMVASGSFDESLCIWSSSTKELLLGPLEHMSSVTSVVFAHFEDVVASACRDGSLYIWGSSTGDKIRRVIASTRPISSIAFSPDDTMIGAACNDHTISIWSVATGQLLAGPLTGHSEPVTSIAFSADGSIVASGSHDYNIRLWDILECKQESHIRQSEGHRFDITVICFNMNIDAPLIATGDSDGSICIWRSTDGKLLLDIPNGHSKSIATLAFSPVEDKLISGAHDQLAMVWSTTTGVELLGPLDGHGHTVSASAFSADGCKIATGGYDRCICLWNSSTGELLLETPLEGHDHWVVRVEFSHDGLTLRSVDYDDQELQWDLITNVTLIEHLAPSRFTGVVSTNYLTLEDNGWVVDAKAEKRVCWIPPDHRGTVQASRGQTFIVGNEVGQITILDVAKIVQSL